MFDTPQEAALKAEVARLKAENAYLRRAVDMPSRRITERGVEEDMLMRPDAMQDRIQLVRMAGVEGALQDGRKWSVMAWHERMHGGKYQVAYYMDRHADNYDDRVFVNDVLPRMHERFIRSLAEMFAPK
jgi:hypothetical protein